MMRHPDRIRMLLQEELTINGNEKIIYLDCQTFEYQGKVIFGTPWCKPFGRWAFMESYEEQDERYARYVDIIGKIDIIMSHDAPYGVSDVILQKDCWWADGSHIGNHSLRKLIEKAKPKMNLHGHLHTTSRDKEMLGDTEVYNVSVLDENYRLVFEPQYFEIN